MKFNAVPPKLVEAPSAIVGEEHVLLLPAAADDMLHYTHDETEDLRFVPEVVLKPANASEISLIMRLCHKNLLRVTSLSIGTGLSGGALTVYRRCCML